MEENNKTKTEELEILNMDSEVKEFVRKTDENKKSTNLTMQRKRRKRASNYPMWLWPAGFAFVLLAVILCGILLCKAPVTMVIIVAVLEALLAGCLCKSPVWLHGLVIVVNAALGIVFHVAVFMILTCVIYLAGILVLHVMDSE